ncbi:putative MFS family arabinose efflux permease [Lentzea atacamensis]|uniref:Putative MFS family arabinose efflux permease n=1 Tax=Lentzea atacamensis TaxID=531938 RepID=A0A316I0D1_9PSEU|nr:MFS transporter [Lentzea atacamensis]PWK80812.1 putative MFS family arabinose efflux permease [Lentzea atacamensis]
MVSPPDELSYRSVLRLPDVGRLVTASTVSRLAEQTFALAIVLYTLERFHSPALAGVVAFIAMAPGLVLSPIAGAVLDRLGAARAITVDLLASAVLVFALVVADRTDFSSSWLLIVVVGLYSLTSPLHLAGVRTLLPRLVPAHALPRVNALDTSTFAVVDVLGPVLAGGLFALTGSWVTLALIGGLYVVAAVLLVPLALRAAEQRAERPHLLREAASGLGYLLRHPTLRALAGSYSLYQVSWGVLVVAVPVTVQRELATADAAEVGTGLLWALVGVTAVVGALFVGRLESTNRERGWIMAGTLGTAVAIFPIAGLGGLVWLAVGLALVGLLSGLVDVGTLTLRQRRTDPDQLGRVLATSISANMSGLPLGSLIGGLVLAWSVPAAFAVGAAAAACSALVALLISRSS